MQYANINSSIAVYKHDVIITILPEHASKLYDGIKLFELRKVVPRDIPRRIFLYETEDVKSVTGYLIINRVISGTPDMIWKETGESATTKTRFFSYFENKSQAHAFEVECAIKFKQPISLKKICTIEQGFRVPQNFLYLKNLPKIHSFLLSILIENIFPIKFDTISLQPIIGKNENRFIDLVDIHISGSYLETSKDYAKKLLLIHKSGSDTEGFITINKFVLEILIGGDLAGFVVLTEKGGGSLKTGPVIFEERFQNLGYGKKLRILLHKLAGQIGFRKVYCTVPAKNLTAMSYLVSSGYRIEAHLNRHYHEDHDELVFGFPLNSYRQPPLELIRPITPIVSFERLEETNLEVVELIESKFQQLYCPMPVGWAVSQVEQAVAFAKGKGSIFKARSIYVGYGICLEVVALCLHKRGGSVKLLLFTKSSHEKSLLNFILFIKSSLIRKKKIKIRKLYTHLPLIDLNCIQAFYNAGFKAEGILERPYNDYTDVLIMGDLLK